MDGLKCIFHIWSCHWLSLPLGVVWRYPIFLILCLKMSPDSLIKPPVKIYFPVNVTPTLRQQALTCIYDIYKVQSCMLSLILKNIIVCKKKKKKML